MLSLVLLLPACGTAIHAVNGEVDINAGALSKTGYTEVDAQSGNTHVHLRQDSFNGTEILNTAIITTPVGIAAKGTAEVNKITAHGNATSQVLGTKNPNIIPKNPNIIPH